MKIKGRVALFILLCMVLALMLALLVACDGKLTLSSSEDYMKELLQKTVFEDAVFVYDREFHLPTFKDLPSGVDVQYFDNTGKSCDEGYKDAGAYTVVAVISFNDVVIKTMNARLEIQKATADVSNLRFEDKELVWDGEKHDIELEGELPAEIYVSYVGESVSDVGEYTFEVHFDVGKNFEPIPPMTAKLTIKELMHTVKFCYTDENGEPATKEIQIGHMKSVPDSEWPVLQQRRGYNVEWDVDDLHFITEDITVTETVSPIQYNINLYDGPQKVDVIPYTVNDEVILPTRAKEYHEFLGWFDEREEKIEKINVGSIGDIDVYAEWEPIIYTVTYELNGGLNDIKNITDLDSNTYVYTVYDELLVLADATDRKGYTFVEWRDKETGEPVDTIGGSVCKNYTLEAIWTPISYTVRYFDGERQIGDAQFSAEDIPELMTPEGKTGYLFDGWRDVATKQTVHTLEGVFQDIDLECVWSPEEYRVVYKIDGETVHEDSYTIESVPEVFEAEDRRGYSFAWYLNDLPFDGVQLGETGDREIIGIYQKIIYSVTYEYDGDKGDNPDSFDVEQLPVALSDGVPPEGMAFDGWYENGVRITKITDIGDKVLVGRSKLPDGFLISEDGKITGYRGAKPSELVIPEQVGGVTVTGVSNDLFDGEVTSLVIEANIDDLTEDMLANCVNLQVLELPASVTYIPAGFLAACHKLERLTVPFVGTREFVGEEYEVGYNLAYIFGDVPGDDLYKVEFNPVNILSGQEQLNDSESLAAYVPNSLKEVTVLRGRIGRGMLGGLTSLQTVSFENCSLSDFSVSCDGLKEIRFGSEMTSVALCAFYDCKNIEKIILKNAALLEQVKEALNKTKPTGDVTIIVGDKGQDTYTYRDGEIM